MADHDDRYYEDEAAEGMDVDDQGGGGGGEEEQRWVGRERGRRKDDDGGWWINEYIYLYIPNYI